MHFTLLNSPFKALYSVVRFHVGATLRNSQLRFEQQKRVHKLFLNMWGARNRGRQRQKFLFCQPSSLQTKSPATLPCTILRTPHLFL